MRKLYKTQFVWLIPNDDNRVEDGRDLRYLFISEHDAEPEWMGLDCSFLEMLIALSRRLQFETGRSAREWFWHLLDNIGLADDNDRNYNEEIVEERIGRVIWRTYAPNGKGGLFPLNHPDEDQTQVEIWYQLSAYLSE